MLQRQDALDDGCNTRSRFEMANLVGSVLEQG
jgi:hypothetical protein